MPSPSRPGAELRALSAFDEQAVLRGLIFTGTALAQRIGEQALRQKEMPEDGLPAATAFEKTARTVRRCMMLARALAEDRAPERPAGPRPVERGVQAERAEVSKPEAEQPEAPGRVEAAGSCAEAPEGGDAAGDDEARADAAAVKRLARRPVGEAVAEMEQALGEAAALAGVDLPVVGFVAPPDGQADGAAPDAVVPGVVGAGVAAAARAPEPPD